MPLRSLLSRLVSRLAAASSGVNGFSALVASASLVPSLAAVWVYHTAGLTLSHYDAKAHLVVARRILDSLTPGWEQIGAVWLPLPHLLNMLPIQVDFFYRTGASAVAISVASFWLAVFAACRLVQQVSGSRLAAASGAMVFALNPNILYLQATPMTEPLLLGLTLLSISLLFDWLDAPPRVPTAAVGWTMAAAWLTRYEAWPVVGSAVVVAAFALWRRDGDWRRALGRTAILAAYPAGALGGFLLMSRITVGEWFVTGGFYQPDNLIDTGRPLRAAVSVWWGTHVVSSYPLLIVASAACAALASAALSRRDRARWLTLLTLAGTAALPWYAFVSGHPFRIRYMIPLVAVMAVTSGAAVGLLPRWRRLAAIALAALAALTVRPIDFGAPMVVEAQLDRENQAERRQVTSYLSREFRGGIVMMSMGSLAHYMQELSAAGFHIRDFLHEGNGEIWNAAVGEPWRHAAWLVIEERAEGGDVLAARARLDPSFLKGYARVVEGGGIALYRRVAGQLADAPDPSRARPEREAKVPASSGR